MISYPIQSFFQLYILLSLFVFEFLIPLLHLSYSVVYLLRLSIYGTGVVNVDLHVQLFKLRLESLWCDAFHDNSMNVLNSHSRSVMLFINTSG